MAAEANISKLMADADVRIDVMIYVPALLAAEQDSDLIEALSEWLPENSDAQLYSIFPELKRFIGGDEYPGEEEIHDALGSNRANHSGGFMFRAASPVPSRFSKDGKSCLASWGHYQSMWLGARSEKEIHSVAILWARENFERCKAKEMKAA